METTVLILVYLLSILLSRYSFIKLNSTTLGDFIICLIPIVNLSVFITFAFIKIYEVLSNPKFKISDWFFGIKK